MIKYIIVVLFAATAFWLLIYSQGQRAFGYHVCTTLGGKSEMIWNDNPNWECKIFGIAFEDKELKFQY